MADEATRAEWRKRKAEWRAANPTRNKELDRAAYWRNKDTINGRRKEVRKLFAEWRRERTAKAAQGAAR